MTPFTHIRVRSHYTLLRSALSVADIVSRAKADGCSHAVLADVNAMFGAVEFYDAAKAAGLVPVIALEIVYKKTPMLLVAKTNAGYANLMRVSTEFMTKAEPDLPTHLDGVAVVLLPSASKSPRFTLPAGVEWYDGADDDGPRAIAAPLVNCRDAQEAEMVISALDQIRDEPKSKNADSEPEAQEAPAHEGGRPRTWFYSPAEAERAFTAVQRENLAKLLSGVNVDLSAFKAEMPRAKLGSKEESADAALVRLCREGLKERFGGSSVDKAYVDRLRHELAVIKKMGFSDYFLVVREFVKFAKDEGILVGPGRGSAVGSLVAYALKITEVDPLRYGLIFERFLNPHRASPPDIDTDIMDTRRDEVIDHLFSEYDPGRIAHIVTFQRVKVKSALRDAWRALPPNIVEGNKTSEVNRVCSLVDSARDESLDDALAASVKLAEEKRRYPEQFALAARLVGMPRQVGTHAAGIVVSGSDIDKAVPLMSGLNGRLTTQLSMEHMERFGLVKMDLLGLRNLTTIQDVVNAARAAGKKVPDLADIPLNDRAAYALFSAGDTNGIFQFESPGMKRTLQRMRPKELEDLSLTSSLFRPGPQENIPLFIARRRGEKPDEYVSPKLKPILEPTHGIVVYQEQVIDVARALAGFDAGRADLFRRAISKKDVGQMASARSDFVAGAVRNGLPETDAVRVFEYLLRFASYGFNHSHAVAYSLVGYWMGWLKAHCFPEFICELLGTVGGNGEKMRQYVDEARAKGVAIAPPDINVSDQHFKAHGGKIYYGLGAVKGIGPDAVKTILECRGNLPQKRFKDIIEALRLLADRASPSSLRANSLTALVEAGAFDGMGVDPKIVRDLVEDVKLGELSLTDSSTVGAFATMYDKATPADLAQYAQQRNRRLAADFGGGSGGQN